MPRPNYENWAVNFATDGTTDIGYRWEMVVPATPSEPITCRHNPNVPSQEQGSPENAVPDPVDRATFVNQYRNWVLGEIYRGEEYSDANVPRILSGVLTHHGCITGWRRLTSNEELSAETLDAYAQILYENLMEHGVGESIASRAVMELRHPRYDADDFVILDESDDDENGDDPMECENSGSPDWEPRLT